MEFELAAPFEPLFHPARYKVFYGGRGGAKSWAFARALLLIGLQRPIRVLCCREFQSSIADSVHKLLCDQIDELGFGSRYVITQKTITGINGTEFIFKGLRHNATEIKSLEGADIAWVEEGQSVSKDSWDLLIPTIRKQGSEIWISFNPGRPDDETYQRFVVQPPDGAVVVKVGWRENPWFPETLRKEMEYCRRVAPADYQHIWEGEPSVLTEAQVFKGRYVIEPFETPEGARFFFGADWGFAADPSTLVRCFIKGDRLYIDYEAYGVGVELDETPQLFDSVPGSRKWPIKADSARPETISYMKKRGFNITAAKKWQGSVEDGLAVLKSFEKIVVHPRCKHAAEEFQLYSYKVDKNNGDILPVLVDAWNHCVAEGTLIYTERGEIPVEQVTTEDRVLTRDGYHRVLFSGVTAANKKCLHIDAFGYSLDCTFDHKLYIIGKGFIDAENVKKGDLLVCVQSGLNMMDLSGVNIRTPSAGVTGFITKNCLLRMAKKLQFGCIDTFGKNQTVKFIKGLSYTIKTAIQKTTLWTISFVSHRKNTQRSILGQWNGLSHKKSILKKSDHSLRLGTLLQRVLQSTVKLVDKPIEILSHTKKSVKTAVKDFSHMPLETEMSFAQTLANQHGGVNRDWTILNAPVHGVAKSSCTTSSKFPKLVVVPVQTILCGNGVEPRVYDLSVEGQHEFFANGILVHNCIDALRYALDGYIKGQGPLKMSSQVRTKMLLDRRAKLAGF